MYTLYKTPASLNFLRLSLIHIFFILLIVLHAHYRRLKQAGSFSSYIRSMLWDPSYDRDRIKAYDYIRVLAVVFVIAAHVVQSDSEPAAGTSAFMALRIMAVLFLNCNLLFVMISGALLLNQKEEPCLLYTSRCA